MITGEQANTSPKSRGIALALNFFLGVFGAHRFYVGKMGTGILQALTLGGMGLWWLYDIILIAAGGFRDAQNRRLVLWQESDEPSRGQLADDQLQALLEEMDTQRMEIGELSERVDFLERMLTQARERGALPGA
jgi:TM2 domain-containing membrane protein YozV